MSVEGIIATAMALREFSLEEVAAFCDETPSVVAEVLHGDNCRLVSVKAGSAERWRLIATGPDGGDPLQLRTVAPPRRPTPRPRRASPLTRLQVAEDALLECSEEDGDDRRLLVATAVNYLKQVLVDLVSGEPSWWAVDLASASVAEALDRHHDSVNSSRLKLVVAVARLSDADASRRTVEPEELASAIPRLRDPAVLDAPYLQRLVSRFFDLMMAQLGARDEQISDPVFRFISAIARRRVRAKVSQSASHAMTLLMPLITANRHLRQDPPALYELVDRLPDGRDRVLVYCDLLRILPSYHSWQEEDERLPGTLVETVLERDASTHLNRCAGALQRDLAASPWTSDAALLGQTAHVFGQLAERDRTLDPTARARVDEARSEIIELAMASA